MVISASPTQARDTVEPIKHRLVFHNHNGDLSSTIHMLPEFYFFIDRQLDMARKKNLCCILAVDE